MRSGPTFLKEFLLIFELQVLTPLNCELLCDTTEEPKGEL